MSTEAAEREDVFYLTDSKWERPNADIALFGK